MKLWHVILLVLVVAGIVFWFPKIEQNRRHSLFCDRVHFQFLSLAKKRPLNVSRQQWEGVVAHTINAWANCLTFTKNIPPAEMDRFEHELHQRVQGPVDLATIDWIWDEVVRLTPNGQSYSDDWRPTTPFWLAEYEKGNHSFGLEVD
jgi:hypothetical protein